MNTINQHLPIFKNMQQQIVSDPSNYENIKPKQKFPLSRIAIFKNGKSIIVPNSMGDPSTPSIVAFLVSLPTL